MNGTILILNGTSSSGKTSILKALQDVMEEPYLDAGIDKFLWMLPDRYLNTSLWQEIYTYTWHPEPGGTNRLSIQITPRGEKLIFGMHQAIAELAKAGNNVVADHVLSEPRWVKECANLFATLPAWFVAIRCPLDVLEKRERERKTRTLGWARAHYDCVHAHGIYDIEVDTSKHTPSECALYIKSCLQDGKQPQAFKMLKNLFFRN